MQSRRTRFLCRARYAAERTDKEDPMRRCLINLTRFGDLLQTQPVIRAFREQGDEVSLICLENFAPAAELLDGLEQVLPLPGGSILAGLSRDWRLCADDLAAWLREARARLRPDEVFNLTPSAGARLLGRLMAFPTERDASPANLAGFGMDAHGFGRNSSPWGSYVQAVTARRGCSPFNLTDGFFRMAGCSGVPDASLRSPSEDAAAQARALLRETSEQSAPSESGEAYVGFQLGASAEARRWPEEHFAALGRMLWEQARLRPLLLGSPEERDLAARCLALGCPGIDLTGRTSLPVLAAVLRQCRLIVTNDTGTMHLAAGLGVPVLALFLATAQPWDTGPYREGSCSLEPRMDCHPCPFNAPCPHAHACRQAVSPETAAGLVLSRLRGGTWEAGPDARREARVWLSLRDGEGFMNLRSLSGDDESERGLWFRVQRGFYRHFLDAWTRDAAQDARREKFSAPAPESLSVFPPGSPCRERIFSTAEKASAMLLLALEQGRLLRLRPTERSRTAFLATCSRLAGIFSDSPDFVPLSLLWRTALQEHGGDLPAVFRFFELLRGELSSLTRRD